MEEKIFKQNVVGFAQYDALRLEYEERLEKQAEKLIDDKYKALRSWQRAFACVVVTLIVFLIGVFGTLTYLFTTYEFETFSYSQDVVNGGENNFVGNDLINYGNPVN